MCRESTSNGTELSFSLVPNPILTLLTFKFFKQQSTDKENLCLLCLPMKCLHYLNLHSLLINHTIKIFLPLRTIPVFFLQFRHEIFDFLQSCIRRDPTLQKTWMPFVRNHNQCSESLRLFEN